MTSETPSLTDTCADYALTLHVLTALVALVATCVLPHQWAAGLVGMCACITFFVCFCLIGHSERACARCRARYGTPSGGDACRSGVG